MGDLRALAAVLLPEALRRSFPPWISWKARLAPAAVVLAAVEEGVVSLAAGVSADWAKRLPAGPLVQHVGACACRSAPRAVAGQSRLGLAGVISRKLEAALASVPAYVAEQLSRHGASRSQIRGHQRR